MHSFKDLMGREWTIEFDVIMREKVLKDAKFDLFSIIDKEQLARLANFEMLVRVLWSMCEDQIVKAGLNYEQFARGLGGDVLESARDDALIGAVGDFFPKNQRTILRSLMSKGKELATEMLAAAVKEIDGLDVKLEVQKMLKDSSTNSLASSASIPGSPESPSAV